MTEEEAQGWISTRYGDAARDRLAQFVDLLITEAGRQSLIARSTFGSIWTRHIVDSAQLLSLAPAQGQWMDVGSGGGLPGIVVAILRSEPLTMVEPRRKRVEFLEEVVEVLDLPNATVVQGNVQGVAVNGFNEVSVVSARAVAPIATLFDWCDRIVSRETHFVLPRGATAADDLAKARESWHGSFHVEQSLTNPDAGIVVAHDVRRR